MKNKSRINSILNASNLDASITGLQTFNLSALALNLATDLDFELPTNLRLGHLAEKVVSQLIKSSTNYKLLYENIQLIEDKKTIGEIDFILSNEKTKELIHMELAYKFYLFDPSISSTTINNWIGPNRNDSLIQKLEKLKSKQFPLLYQECARSIFDNIELKTLSQQLCLLVSLFIPYQYKASFDPAYQKAIKGYYLTLEQFTNFDHSEKSYYLPQKKEWGIHPSENDTWTSFNGIENDMNISIKEKQAVLCWQKHENSYLAFFIVWWSI